MVKKILLVAAGVLIGITGSAVAQPWGGGPGGRDRDELVCNVNHGDGGRGGIVYLSMSCRRFR